MSEENVETIRAVYDRYREGDFGASADLLDPHVVLVLPKAGDWGPETPESGLFVGSEAIATYTRDSLLKPWADFTMGRALANVSRSGHRLDRLRCWTVHDRDRIVAAVVQPALGGVERHVRDPQEVVDG